MLFDSRQFRCKPVVVVMPQRPTQNIAAWHEPSVIIGPRLQLEDWVHQEAHQEVVRPLDLQERLQPGIITLSHAPKQFDLSHEEIDAHGEIAGKVLAGKNDGEGCADMLLKSCHTEVAPSVHLFLRWSAAIPFLD
jgi:hypothetical protein